MKVKFKTGDFYLGDCFEVMATLSSGSVDMVLNDPPYGTTQNKWDAVIPFEPMWGAYWRLLKSNGAAVFTAAQPFTSALVMSQPNKFRHEWIWIKNRGSNFANTVREPMKEHESVLTFSRGRWTYNKQMQERTGGGLSRVGYDFTSRTNTSNYGDIGAPAKNQGELRVPSSWQKFNTEVGLHPTQKPVALFEYLIRTYTSPGELVLDNTAGSGTTAIAAMRSGRRWVCIERDEEYFTKACERIRAEEDSAGLFS